MLRLALSLALAFASLSSLAQPWPSRTVRVILSQPPGSSPDILARMLAERLTRQWGQTVLVENRPGGQNVVGAQAAARAAPDGYTFYYATTAALVVNVYTFKQLPYDPRKDFVPVTMIGLSPFVLAVNPSVPAKTLTELVAYAKANPGKLNVATEGTKTLSGLLTDMIAATGGIDILHVPYNGVQPGILDTIAGRTLGTVQSSTALAQHLKRGALRPIAASFPKRVTGLEDVPTIGETWPGFEYVGWHGLAAPTGTPDEAIRRFSRDLDTLMKQPDVAAKLVEFGVIPEGGTPEQMGEFLRQEHVRWAKLVKDIHAVPE
ncbi:MAG: tripartite tricarboxylate transporter substrate binding protein [Betaproteobacteria bacterium]|nr:tripartite tricarboxylate transporter substrate binding protein [Betaproteobacteria bacterium]